MTNVVPQFFIFYFFYFQER